jgi:hypothetical protein
MLPELNEHRAQDKGLRCPGRDGGRDHEPPEGEKTRKKASTLDGLFCAVFPPEVALGAWLPARPGPAPREGCLLQY